MLLEIIRQFNWVDMLIVIIFIRICYIAMDRGFIVEIFKLFGTFFALYLSLHYYTHLSDAIRSKISMGIMPLEFFDFLCFLILLFAGYAFFIILREVFGRFFKTEAVPTLSKWGGLILGIVRSFLLTSILCFSLVIACLTYFKLSVRNSFTGQRMFRVAPMVYSGIWEGFMSKLMTTEKYNSTIREVQEDFRQ
jgi:uncharacterized membrane protein required for colicin V production